jgi:eukaryotic-like serine/threonine-protein kinase
MVALKLLRPDFAQAIGPERFLQKIRIAAGLSHPNILSIFDSGQADGLLYYVMPYIEGETLRHRLVRERQLPVPEAVRIVQEVAEGLGTRTAMA